MIDFKKVTGIIAGLGLILGTTTTTVAMTPNTPSTSSTFRQIEQPLSLKLVVTLGGLGLIGLELWWFLFYQSQSQKAEAKEGVQELTITVDSGYVPNHVIVQAGQPVKLNFFRKDPSSCLNQVLIPDFKISKNLELNQMTSVEFTPEKTGQYSFTCGMNMFKGTIEVETAK
ncbi:conserved hypothetical protein [Gloeothece citriformis PCC 7424]|uniref:EfeO-type cupredoxin-like domain-containing protein n=1 Tax=Gloeothece citriformis (strain PCC 7424) TaxID=65393 RepID=B7K8X4_GLOC7|nr:cupredoxin domain-containing protein [Gloeothece citriformis]ACK72743.1 conserved hypothetical protein [Gloeothece citriformis PCC 7424]